LFFAQTNTFGVAAHASPSSQGTDLTVGYRGANIAIVPVTATDENGNLVLIAGTGKDVGDAMSVFGHFSGKIDSATTVGLGSFFATGVAARHLAIGFRSRLEKAAATAPAPQ
jgi:hypothetical protein